MTKSKKIDARQRDLRNRLWPEVTEDQLWIRQNSKGFATIPRTMPLMMTIMDDMSKTKPVSSTYFELFCRGFDDCMIVLNKHKEMAFHAGFSGQRAERTWRERLKILENLGFIRLMSGPSGTESYALIMNPYHVIQAHHGKGTGLTNEKYNTLLARVSEIGATDLDAKEDAKNEKVLADKKQSPRRKTTLVFKKTKKIGQAK